MVNVCEFTMNFKRRNANSQRSNLLIFYGKNIRYRLSRRTRTDGS